MKLDYILILILFILSFCYSHYLKRKQLKEIGLEQEKKLKERKTKLRLIPGGANSYDKEPLVKKKDNDLGVNNELGIHNQWNHNSRVTCVSATSPTKTGKILKLYKFNSKTTLSELAKKNS
jgi:hypothetical protein